MNNSQTASIRQGLEDAISVLMESFPFPSHITTEQECENFLRSMFSDLINEVNYSEIAETLTAQDHE